MVKSSKSAKRDKAIYAKKYRKRHRSILLKKKADYRKKHRAELAAKQLKYRNENLEECRARDRDYASKNKTASKIRLKLWRKAKKDDPEYIEKRRKERIRYRKRKTFLILERCKVDPAYHLLKKMRARVGIAIRTAKARKSARTMELVGCTVSELVSHIESKFAAGMSWANRSEWHLDHIKPCAKFDLTDPKQQLECFNFRNIQPLWKLDNLRKGSK